MWKQFIETVTNVLTLMQRMERQEKEFKDLRQEMKRNHGDCAAVGL